VYVPLNTNELLIVAKRVELQQLLRSFDYLSVRLTCALKIAKAFSLLCSNQSQTKMERLHPRSDNI